MAKAQWLRFTYGIRWLWERLFRFYWIGRIKTTWCRCCREQRAQKEPWNERENLLYKKEAILMALQISIVSPSSAWPLAWARFFVCGQISTTSSSSSAAAATATTMSSALSTWNKRADSIRHPLIKWQANWVSGAFAASVCSRTFTVNENTRTLDTIGRPEMDGTYSFMHAWIVRRQEMHQFYRKPHY